ncbi:hypothetical protein NUH88_03495 [Nisaea acidiphila]|uniref:Pilus formation protein N-terminal domain-containing protein n=1 Tax=Nisaea acidiphila TaxID=1862145 RepID=A0A9J7AWE7_9PROT|nr:hypothetical protein [Nisaea acidiphila]UUX50769.1 hypothetical protein NUH88_03495 [Nisaea acidiphila]
MTIYRVLRKASFAVAFLTLSLSAAAAEKMPSSVSKIIPPELNLFNPETYDPVKTVLRVDLEGTNIAIEKVVEEGAGYVIRIPGQGKYLIYAEDVETNLDAEFQQKCRTQVTSASAAASGTGRGFGAGCSQ